MAFEYSVRTPPRDKPEVRDENAALILQAVKEYGPINSADLSLMYPEIKDLEIELARLTSAERLWKDNEADRPRY